MKIEHIAMYVNDLEAAKVFFVKYLNGTANDGYYNKSTDFRSYFISFDDGARLEIMKKPEMADDKKSPPEQALSMLLSALAIKKQSIPLLLV